MKNFLSIVLKQTTLFSISVLVGAMALSAAYERAYGQEINFEEQMAYGLNFFNGKTYTSSFSPKTENTLYFIADQYNVIAPRMTLVYFWPITKRFMAGWQSLNEPVEGTLEILKDGKAISTLERRDYSFYYAGGYYGDVSEVVLDQAAHDRYKEYQEATDNYYESLSDYYDKQLAYQKELDVFYEKLRVRSQIREQYEKEVEEYNKKLVEAARKGLKYNVPPPKERGNEMIDVPKEPARPTSPAFYVAQPTQAFVVKLPEGHYQIRLRSPEGKVVEGSEKRLIVFSKRRSGGMGYEVAPGENWASRVTSSDPAEIIYVKGGKSTLYFQPFHQDEFNDLYYAKLEDPQNDGRIEKHRWVNVKQEEKGTLQLRRGAEILSSIKEFPYYVEAGLDGNFKIVVFDKNNDMFADKFPTFVGHKLDLDVLRGGYGVRTLDEKDKALRGSGRQIRPVAEESQIALYGPSFLSLVAGVFVLVWRRMKK